MKQRVFIALAAVLALAVAGCGSNRDTGVVLGSIVGGVAGYAIDDGGALGTTLGALGGGVVGGLVGAQLDKAARQRQLAAMHAAWNAKTGERKTWSSTSVNNGRTETSSGWVEPTSERYVSNKGQYCRNMLSHVQYPDGKKEQGKNVSCETSSGQVVLMPT